VIIPSEFKKAGRLKDQKCYYSQAGSSTYYMQKAQPSKEESSATPTHYNAKNHLKQRDEAK